MLPARKLANSRPHRKHRSWTQSWTAYVLLLVVGLLALVLAAAGLGLSAFGEASKIASVLDCRGNAGACVLRNGTNLVISSPDNVHTARLSTVDDGPFGSALSLEVRSGATNGDQSRYIFRGDGTVAVTNSAGQPLYTLSRDCMGQSGKSQCSDF